MRDARHQPPEGCEFFRFDQEVLGLLQMAQRRFGRIPGAAQLPFTGVQRGLGALALGDLFGRDVDADDLAGRIAQRMPIRHP